MFCTTECWSCEYKNWEHYISKQELYFENQQLKEDNKTLRENYENGIKLLKQNKQLKLVLDEIRDVLNNQMDYREFVDVVNAIEEILDKVEYLC